MPELTALHHRALRKLQDIQDGEGPDGFKALLETARYMAIVDICHAIRKDFRERPKP